MIHTDKDGKGLREFFSNGVVIDRCLSYVDDSTGECRGYPSDAPTSWNAATKPKEETFFMDNITVQYKE